MKYHFIQNRYLVHDSFSVHSTYILANMARVDTSICDDSTLYQLPPEMWQKILGYVPLKERLEKVQFVCQMFAGLCNGSELNAKLDFKDCVYMPDELCVGTVVKNQNFVRYLSFRDCSWFSRSVYRNFPTLNKLVTLDLTGVRLGVTQLLSIFQHTPALRNLSLTITIDILSNLIIHMKGQKLGLKVLHAEVHQTTAYPILQEFEMRLLEKFIESFCHGEANSVSIRKDWYHQTTRSDFVLASERILPGSSGTIYHHGRISGDGGDDAFVSNISNLLKMSGLHCIQTDSCKRQKSNELRYLSLPDLCVYVAEVRDCVCDGVSFPTSLPTLQYLSMPPFFKINNFQCFADTIVGILLECQMPKLTHLHFCFRRLVGDRVVPAKIYQRLGSFVNLIELNVSSLGLDLFTLMDAVKDLKHLRGLAFSVNASILNHTEPESQTLCREPVMTGVCTQFFETLVTTFPNLKKLELQPYIDFYDPIDTRDLVLVSSLSELEHLVINDVNLTNTSYFEEMWRNFYNIRSLILSAGSTDVSYDANFTKHLHLMHHISCIYLNHPKLLISETLGHLRRCKQLRKIVILGNKFGFSPSSREHDTVESIAKALDALLKDCKLICQIYIFCSSACNTVKLAVSQCAQNMKANGRNVVISCNESTELRFRFDQRLESRFSSISEVATCSPFELLV